MRYHIETREVLAGAYLGPNKSRGRMLSHAAVVTEDGCLVSVLCRRVSVDSLADAKAQDILLPPTCDYCGRALRRKAAALAPPEEPSK